MEELGSGHQMISCRYSSASSSSSNLPKLLSHQQPASILADAALSKTALTLAWAWRKLSGAGSHGRIVHVTPSESVNGGFGFLGLRPGLRAATVGVTCSARTSRIASKKTSSA